MNSHTRGTITFSIRGFDKEVEDLISVIGVTPAGFKRRGDRTLPHRSSLILNNSVYYEYSVEEDELWSDSIMKIVDSLGGLDALEGTLKIFSPQYVHFDLCVNVSSNHNQKDGYIEPDVLQQICRIGSSIGFSFV